MLLSIVGSRPVLVIGGFDGRFGVLCEDGNAARAVDGPCS